MANRAGGGTLYRDLAWHIFLGCTPCSIGCLHCYAAMMAYQQAKCGPAGRDYVGLTKMTKTKGAAWTGKTVMRTERLTEPYHHEGKRIWVAPMSDPFHPNFTLRQIALVYAIIADCQPLNNEFLVLTKRIERMRKLSSDGTLHEAVEEILDREVEWPLKNVWTGTSVENAQALWRLKELFKVPSDHHYVSFQPLLSEMNIRPYLAKGQLDYAVIGTEAGTMCRTPSPDVVVAMEEQLRAAKVPFFTECYPT